MDVELKLIKPGELITISDDGDGFFRESKVGKVFNAEIKEIRNYAFHKKIISLFRMMHDILPPPAPVEFMGRMVTPEHTFDNTRKFLTVKAGHYNVNGFPDGSVRVEAKSISFAKMKQDEFDKLFSSVINACLKILPDTWTEENLRETANNILKYD